MPYIAKLKLVAADTTLISAIFIDPLLPLEDIRETITISIVQMKIKDQMLLHKSNDTLKMGNLKRV